MSTEVQNFDATNIPPQQSGGKHPEGKGFLFQITNTYGKKNNNTPGGQFVVEFTSPAGRIENRYNLWNENDKAREIAQKELSALCHATGVFQLAFVGIPPEQYGRELRGAIGVMDVGPQSNNPDFNEVKKVYDKNGNEPGKGPASAPQPQQQSTAWANTQQAPAAAPANNGSWNNNAVPPGNAGGGTAPQGWTAGPTNTTPAATGAPSSGPPWAR